MVKKNSICILISVVIMIALPELAVIFVKADSAMAIFLLIFFVINPIAAITIGIFAGKNISFAWFQPLLLAMLFVLGSWISFDKGEKDFIFMQ